MREGNPLDEVQGGLPKNFIRPCLLLLIGEQPSHGYDLLERLGTLGIGGSDPGGLYRTLRSMEQEGLVTSTWEMSTVGPARRTYRLTDEGFDWLHAWSGALAESRRILSGYLRRYEALAVRGEVSADHR
ncbi:MAG: helix-turn-helix transcriptional regulator [Actinomycetota bacterium]|nr:helix-turn-helix transcriptional regulator [Actinomycetota bacterium]